MWNSIPQTQMQDFMNTVFLKTVPFPQTLRYVSWGIQKHTDAKVQDSHIGRM